MWGSHYSVEAQLAPESVWQVWADFQNAATRVIHRLERLDGQRTRITYRTEITGAGADELGPRPGPGVIAAFPDTVAKLVELARLRESGS